MPRDNKKTLRLVGDFLRKTLKGPKQAEEGKWFLVDLQEELSKSLKPLAVKTLSISDVLDIFGITEDIYGQGVWALSDELLDIPDSLYKDLDNTARALGQDPHNEAACHFRLNDILKDVVIEEQHHAMASNSSQKHLSPICLTPEANLAREVKFKGEDRLLTGKADYAMWYGDGAMDTNMVVVEAKRHGQVGDDIAQGLAYMAIVAEIRKEEGQHKAVVYGCVTDSYHFAFLRLDSQMRYSIWYQDWGRRAMSYLHRSESRIYSHLRSMTRMAVLSSPRTSPVRVRKVRDGPSDDQPYHQRFASDDEMA